MASSTYQTYLMYKATTGGSATFSKLTDIISLPDLGAPPEQIDVTTLSDRQRKYIPGVEDFSIDDIKEYEKDWSNVKFFMIGGSHGYFIYLWLNALVGKIGTYTILIISAVIASPFALGMVSVYSQFMQSFGKQTQLILAAPFAGQIYLVIHSVLVGLIVSIIMYGNVKKGIKFSVPLALVSYGIFYLISNFAGAMFLS